MDAIKKELSDFNYSTHHDCRFGKTSMQNWKDSLHLTKEKLLHTHYQNVVSARLPLYPCQVKRKRTMVATNAPGIAWLTGMVNGLI